MKNFALFLICFFSLNAAAVSSVNVTKGHSDPIPLAINNFAGVDPYDVKLAKDIVKVISNDLKGSGMFRPISPAAFIEKKIGTRHKPLFAAWQQINASLLLNGDVSKLRSGKLQVNFILWDSILEASMMSESFELPEHLWRQVAHKISDRVYKKITGYAGYFNSKIAYVSETGPYLKRIKRLAIMDQDGENHRYLTDGKDLVLTPRFSPDAKKILYLSYKNELPQVHMLDLRTGRSSLIGNFPGMSFAPKFSPDGKKALLSIAKDGSTHIYEINLRNKRMKQLTKGISINTSPSYSPDGKKIAFNSDRLGMRQIFTMNRDGSNKQRISFGGGNYAEPNWSSRNYIAFTKITRDFGFTIGVMSPNPHESQNRERLITRGYLVESPAWADNGRVLVFTKGMPPRGKRTKGLNRIYTIDFTGYNERIIPTPHDASGPDWSKNL
ncbi:MAG: Tol-Pal system beta propeller repeat protein TolB [Rickettsiales bacterium]|nr:MAG: Tol-Pal system beta propeller repeat protein TolB [Rickettsiales bacterium]